MWGKPVFIQQHPSRRLRGGDDLVFPAYVQTPLDISLFKLHALCLQKGHIKQILLSITDVYKLQRIHCPPYCTLGFVFIAAIIPPQVVESENHQARTSIPRSQAAVYLISFRLSSCSPSFQFKNTNVFSSALVLDIILAISHYRVVLPDLSLCPHIPYSA